MTELHPDLSQKSLWAALVGDLDDRVDLDVVMTDVSKLRIQPVTNNSQDCGRSSLELRKIAVGDQINGAAS